MYFKVGKWIKGNQGTKIEKNQTRSQSHRNWTIRFAKLEYPIFLEQIESEYVLRFSLFRKDLVVSDSKSYVMLAI
jgi:hypothetical protein